MKFMNAFFRWPKLKLLSTKKLTYLIKTTIDKRSTVFFSGLLVSFFLTAVCVGALETGVANAQAPRTFRVPASITRDCSVSVTEQLQAWIDSVPNGTRLSPNILDFGSGCYGLGSLESGTDGAMRNLGPRNGLLIHPPQFPERKLVG